MCWGRHLEADGDAAGLFAHLVGEGAEVVGGHQVREPGRADRGGAGLESAHLGDLSDHLGAGQVSPGTGLRSLSPLEVEGLRQAGPLSMDQPNLADASS